MLDPTAFIACITILLFLSRGGGESLAARSKVAKVGAMLGHFSVLGTIFCVLGASWALCGRLWLVFVVLGACWTCRVRFWKVLGRAGEGFGSLGTSFSKFFPTFAVGLRKSLDLYKTLAGAVKIKVCA